MIRSLLFFGGQFLAYVAFVAVGVTSQQSGSGAVDAIVPVFWAVRVLLSVFYLASVSGRLKAAGWTQWSMLLLLVPVVGFVYLFLLALKVSEPDAFVGELSG